MKLVVQSTRIGQGRQSVSANPIAVGGIGTRLAAAAQQTSLTSPDRVRGVTIGQIFHRLQYAYQRQ